MKLKEHVRYSIYLSERELFLLDVLLSSVVVNQRKDYTGQELQVLNEAIDFNCDFSRLIAKIIKKDKPL